MGEMNEKSIRTTLDERKSTYVTDMRKQSLFDLVDTDNSGTIDKKEFGQLYDVVKEQVQADLSAKMQTEEKATRAKRKAKLFALIGGLLLAFLVMSIAANSAMVFYMLEATKDTETGEGAVMVAKHNDSIVKTAIASQKIPLKLLPLLPAEKLAQAKYLLVKQPHTPPELSAQGLLSADTDESTIGELESQAYYIDVGLTITGYVRQSRLAMTFYTSIGHRLVVDHGTAVIYAGDTNYSVCSGNVGCSSVKLDDVDVTATQAEFEETMLEEGFAPSRRLAQFEDGSRALAGRCRRSLREVDDLLASADVTWRAPDRRLDTGNGHSWGGDWSCCVLTLGWDCCVHIWEEHMHVHIPHVHVPWGR